MRYFNRKLLPYFLGITPYFSPIYFLGKTRISAIQNRLDTTFFNPFEWRNLACSAFQLVTLFGFTKIVTGGEYYRFLGVLTFIYPPDPF